MGKTLISSKATAIAAKANKEHGDGTVILGSQIKNRALPKVTSGSLSFDVALGGGWPTNKWNEIIGESSHGKTATVLKTIAANQARLDDWVAVWIAAEPFVDSYAAMLGCDLERMIIVDTNIMEDAYELVLDYASSMVVDCVVIDSLPALVPDPENEADMDEYQVGLGARLTNKFFRKVKQPMHRSLLEVERPILGLVINQWREKVGVMYGDNRTTPGGKGKDFEYFTRVEVRRGEWIKDDEKKEKIHTRKGEAKSTPVKVGQEIRLNVIKNKAAVPGRSAVVDFYFDDATVDGVKHLAGSYDRVRDVLQTALGLGMIYHRGGGYYRFGEMEWKGFAGVERAATEDPTVLDAITDEVMSVVNRKAGVS